MKILEFLFQGPIQLEKSIGIFRCCDIWLHSDCALSDHCLLLHFLWHWMLLVSVCNNSKRHEKEYEALQQECRIWSKFSNYCGPSRWFHRNAFIFEKVSFHFHKISCKYTNSRKFLSIRSLEGFSAIYQIPLLVIFLWSLITISSAMLLIQMQMVESLFSIVCVFSFLSTKSKSQFLHRMITTRWCSFW